MDEKKYKKQFGIKPKNETLLKNALDRAHDIRTFEIELYWKRATYFWTLIASAFAAYFLVIDKAKDGKFYAFLISCVGFLFTFAWLQVNRGSKQWQENWENHVDLLENDITGPLHKTTLSRPENADKRFEKYITGPGSVSVSKTNQIVNLYTLFIWAFLAWSTLENFNCRSTISLKHVIVVFMTIFACGLILRNGGTHKNGHYPNATLRITEITPKKN